MVFTADQLDNLAKGLSIVPEGTVLNEQGGTVVVALSGKAVSDFAADAAAREHRKDIGVLSFEGATDFLRGERTRNFAINHARTSVDNPIIMSTGAHHPTVVPGELPDQPSAYRLTLAIGKRPFA